MISDMYLTLWKLAIRPLRADALGYKYAQHFSTAFKNFMGVSPFLLSREIQEMIYATSRFR